MGSYPPGTTTRHVDEWINDDMGTILCLRCAHYEDEHGDGFPDDHDGSCRHLDCHCQYFV